MKLSFFKKLGCGVLALLVGALVLFLDFTYKTFSIHQSVEKVDAIVVLAGGRGRVEEGVRLYRDNGGRWLLLIGVDPSVKKSELYREGHSARSAENVLLEKVSRNTLENALYAKDLLVSKGITSVSLITSRYHMKRAVLIFTTILPSTIKIYPHPVDSKNLKDEWWRHSGSFRLLFIEFYKYYVYKLLFLFVSGDFRGSSLRM